VNSRAPALKKFLTPALAVSLFLLIVGAKWATFDRFGSPMPDWDQWDAEAAELFTPWFENDHFAQHLFHPHNEHRVILTKLQNLALGVLNGQWDSRLEAVTNAMLHAALGVAFWVCACRWAGVAQASSPAQKTNAGGTTALASAALFVVTAALFGLPLAWQNILGGFHSQQYWLLGLSFAAIVTLPFAGAWSGAWWLGAVAATLALGSMGSGFLAAGIVLVVVGWRIFRREVIWREMMPTLVFAAALVAIGLLTRVEVTWHQKLKATSVSEFYFSIVHSLQWPVRDHDWVAAVMWAPWTMIAWRAIRGREQSRAMTTILALGAWVLLQVVATAYARGAGADYPASRYMDTLAFGAMVNAAALAWLFAPESLNKPRTLHAVVTVAWLAVLAWGLYEVCNRNLRYELPDAKKYYVKAEGLMARYLATNDPKHLDSPDIPFPSAQDLIERLSHPSLRALMPVPIRAPLPLGPANENQSAFLENDARGADPEHPPRVGLSPTTSPLDASKTWGSFAPDGITTGKTGEWRSTPVTSTVGGWLKFETAGHLGNPNGGVTLELRSVATNAVLATIEPTKIPGHAWRSAYLRAPREPFVVVARDEHAARWLAFSAPVEMGRLSYWAWRASKHGLLILYCAAAATVALATIGFWVRRVIPNAPLTPSAPPLRPVR
jgi:hypothetical protein